MRADEPLAVALVSEKPSPTWRDVQLQLEGWINYYGRLSKSMLHPVSDSSTTRSLGGPGGNTNACAATRAARRFIADVARREPGLFAHWQAGALRPDGWMKGAGCAEIVHVRLYVQRVVMLRMALGVLRFPW